MQNLSNENEFDLHEKELVDGSHFHWYEWLYTKTRLCTEVKGKREMAYWASLPQRPRPGGSWTESIGFSKKADPL